MRIRKTKLFSIPGVLLRKWPLLLVCSLIYGLLHSRNPLMSNSSSVTFTDANQYMDYVNITDPYLNYVIFNECSLPPELLSLSDPTDFYTFPLNSWHRYCNESLASFDPRRQFVIWGQLIDNHLTNYGSLDGLSLPFEWKLVLDLQVPSFLNDLDLYSCQKLFSHLSIDSIPSKNISFYCTNDFGGGPQMVSPINFKTSEHNYKALNQLYIYQSMSIPDRIIFTFNGSSLLVPTTNEIKQDTPIYNAINYRNLIDSIGNKLNSLDSSKDSYPLTDHPRIFRERFTSGIKLFKKDFIFDFNEFLQHLKSRYQFTSNQFDQNLMDSVLYQISLEPNEVKYFNEPKLPSKGGGHFDNRFFHTVDYNQYERINILNRLSKSWLAFSNSIGIKTWLSHGTLLGWYWNGLNLPWDNDLDIQITIESLIKLARNYNNSMIVNWNDHNQFGRYLLDINPNFYNRETSGGDNVIDGRFIDIETGFYIDITALSFSDRSKYLSILEKQLVEFNQVLDSDYLQNEQSHTIIKSEYHKSLFKQRAKLFNQQMIYNCKNNHFYTLEDLSPLILTQFENYWGYIPNQYEKILSREYPKSLHYKKFKNYCYNPWLRLWVDCKICNYESICHDKNSLIYHNFTKEFTQIHKNIIMHYHSSSIHDLPNLYDLPKPEFYIDPLLIRYLQKIINP